ncbi:hypothetical protein MLD38_035036 [Melastoma candidum]|uniref:Uncharacterized protein n=1 Tax=Melastoma candidum TaxID=119954 RepID=A0ACB9MBX9_9MYRT|nr:hypothetical protein MLD38_035036 [Melastoma candidum]
MSAARCCLHRPVVVIDDGRVPPPNPPPHDAAFRLPLLRPVQAGSGRRVAVLLATLPFCLVSTPPWSAEARERRNRKAIPLEEYSTSRKFVSVCELLILVVDFEWAVCVVS